MHHAGETGADEADGGFDAGPDHDLRSQHLQLFDKQESRDDSRDLIRNKNESLRPKCVLRLKSYLDWGRITRKY